MQKPGLTRKNLASNAAAVESRRRFAFVPFLVLIGALAANVLPSTMTLTTVYPAPSGVYRHLITTQDAYFARDAGSVGIGTASPNAKLDLRGAPSSRVQFTASDGNSASAMIRAGAARNAVYGSDVGIDFRTGANWTNADSGGVTVMSLTTSGNVGIGTASPAYKLDVAGDVRWSGALQGGAVPWARIPATTCSGGSGYYAYGTNSSGLVCSPLPAASGITINSMTGANFAIAAGSGISIANTAGSPNTITITNTSGGGGAVSGSGSANYAAKWTGSSSLGTGAIYDNGYVGIGTTAPIEQLHVNGSVYVGGNYFKGGNLAAVNNAISLWGGAGGGMVSGYSDGKSIAMGRGSPWAPLGVGVAAGTTPLGVFYVDSVWGNETAIGTYVNGPWQVRLWAENPAGFAAADMIVAKSGHIALRTQQTERLLIWPDGTIHFSPGDDYMYTNGNMNVNDIWLRSSGRWVSSFSDARLKKDVLPLGQTLEKLEKINGVAFSWNDLYPKPQGAVVPAGRNIGVLAQDVERVFPELVRSGGEYKSVDYNGLTAVLLEAVKELKAENASLKTEDASLKARIGALEAK